MSDIPNARRLLKIALKDHDWMIVAIAITLLDREKPRFIVKAKFPCLTTKQKQRARCLRKAGWGINDIAVKLKTNVGRVSKACANVRRTK